MKFFTASIEKAGMNPDKISLENLPDESITWLADDAKEKSPATEKIYLIAASRFFAFLSANDLKDVNLSRIQLLVQQNSRKQGERLPQFPSSEIDTLINKMMAMENYPEEDIWLQLRYYRDRALIVTLADTGMRIHEACKILRENVNWNENFGIVIGKGNKEAVIRFSDRAIRILRDYHTVCERNIKIKPGHGDYAKLIGKRPLFYSHDIRSRNRYSPITPTTGRNIVDQRAREFLGENAASTITPHSFRHYFVTRILRSSNNLKLAQELARHKNIAVTQRYAHISNEELDRGFHEAMQDSPTPKK